MRSEWQKRMGVGERQVHRRPDASPTQTTIVEGEHKRIAGWHTEHFKDGRVDATVTPDQVHIKCEVDKDGIVSAATQTD